MTINITGPELRELKPRILVLGVGGAGGNAINGMIDAGMNGVEFVAVNTDAQDLKMNKANSKIQLGTNLTKGLGAGAKQHVGEASADESLNDIIDYIKGSNMVFITAGMGGGTGTGASHVIARAAKELNILTVGVVTLPFLYEGPKRMRQALEGLDKLKRHLDTNIVVPNQNLFKIINEKTTFKNSFGLSNDVLKLGVQSVTDLMVRPGLINLDFADVETIMKGMGKAMMGTGEAEGENRAEAAANAALHNPLIDEYSLKGAKGLLVNITAGADLTAFEVDAAVNKIRAEVDSEAELIFGSIEDQNLDGKIRVSIVATALDGQVPDRKSVVSMVHHIQNRSSGYNHVASALGATQPLNAIDGATALNLDTPLNEDLNTAIVKEKEEVVVDKKESIRAENNLSYEEENLNQSDEISLDSANYFQNINDEQQEIREAQEAFADDGKPQESDRVNSVAESSMNQDSNYSNESTPDLFSKQADEKVHNEYNIEEKEPEMFENQDGEEDFEIPAFLRRQKS